MSLNECTRKPISSRVGVGTRVAKSPRATARVPCISNWIGTTRRRAKKNAPYTDASSEISSTRLSVSVNAYFSAVRRYWSSENCV